jgi:cell division septum initiation protein DivIVA
MPDVQGKLDEIITMVETAKGKALSGSAAIIDRAALLGALEELRQLLPAEMSEARSLLREREDLQATSRAEADVLLGKAHAEADRLAVAARQERDRMLTESALIAEAERVAAEITQDAEAEAQRMREQTDDYIDASLARFEQLLSSSLDTVSRGRERVAASRIEVSEQLGQSAPQDALEGFSAYADAAAPEAGVQDNGDADASGWQAEPFESQAAEASHTAPAN